MAESTKHIDMTYLQDMSGGDPEFIQEILTTFLESSVILVVAIHPKGEPPTVPVQ